MAEEEEEGQEENNRPDVPKVPYTNPLNVFGNSIILLTDPSDALHEVELKLRNIRIQDEKIIKLGDPLMNDYGISNVIGLVLESLVNRDVILGRLENNEIDSLRNFLADTLSRDLMVNRIRYGIKDMRTRDVIYFMCVAKAYVCMKRGFKGGERGFWKGSTTNIRHEVIANDQKKKGFFGLRRK